MFTVYPSNRLEYLSTLLFAVMKKHHPHILAPQTIIVESHGIRHWLQMQLAQEQGISMNLKFQMPSAFIWELSRRLLGEGRIPETSPYSESVLTWRIDAILASSEFVNAPDASEATRYWLSDNGYADGLKRYQLAAKLASIFEQYMKYRPEWLNDWIAGIDTPTHKDTPWQRRIWQQLIAQDLGAGINIPPTDIQHDVMTRFAEKSVALPSHIFLFGINTLPKPTLDFFQTLSGHCHVHLFHLNPCVEYWGDVLSDKAAANMLRQQQWEGWLGQDDQTAQTNPLLANLGQQGKAFFKALQNANDFEISAFDDDVVTGNPQVQQGVLARLQRDILKLENAASHPVAMPVDDTLSIVSCHSTLREIQALHDYLLHCLNDDNTLKPRDILVMCPDIEEYAPYIDAVFRRPWHEQDDDAAPRLTCSIADRVILEEEPLIAAFLDLLQLPDSRFEVSKILDYLRVPAIQSRFDFSDTELDDIEWWLKEASIHWGVDAENKAKQAGLESASPLYTWGWGLERLLLGFAHGDHETMLDDRLLLPHIEGQNALLLGQLVHLLNRLRYHAGELTKPRRAEDWESYLKSLKESLFTPTEEEQNAARFIDDAIHQLKKATENAGYVDEISFPVIQSYFSHQFSIPDTGNHFMTGQVTFCSMVPMRSIPFRVIAILGLNDGKFPRQDRPVSFDLMSGDAFRPGDRSRRADDRYIFLETLISARDKLYLSYQGRNIQNNEVREPSLVLKELMHYLESGYGWQSGYVIQQPLQAFSPDCFRSPKPGFDKHWLNLATATRDRDNAITLPQMTLGDDAIELETLVRFYDDPLRWFGQQRLNLYLDSMEMLADDAEPFDVDTLTAYQIRAQFLNDLLAGESSDLYITREKARGVLPESSAADRKLDELNSQVDPFYQALCEQGVVESEWIEIDIAGIKLAAEIFWLEKGKKMLMHRSAKRKEKDELRMWLHHLVATVHLQNQGKAADITTEGLYFSKSGYDKLAACWFSPVTEPATASAQLEAWVDTWFHKGACQPMILHARVGKAICDNAAKESADILQEALVDNAYFDWFFGHSMALDTESRDGLTALYSPLYNHLNEKK